MRLSLLVSLLAIVATPVFAVGGDDGHSNSAGTLAQSQGVKRKRVSFEADSKVDLQRNDKGKEKVKKRRTLQEITKEKSLQLSHKEVRSFFAAPMNRHRFPGAYEKSEEIYQLMMDKAPYVSEALIPTRVVLSHVLPDHFPTPVSLKYEFNFGRQKSTKEEMRFNFEIFGETLSKFKTIQSLEFTNLKKKKLITSQAITAFLRKIKDVEIGFLKIKDMPFTSEDFSFYILPAICNIKNLQGLSLSNPFFSSDNEDTHEEIYDYLDIENQIYTELTKAQLPLKTLEFEHFSPDDEISRSSFNKLMASPSISEEIVLKNLSFDWKTRESLVNAVDNNSQLKKVVMVGGFCFSEAAKMHEIEFWKDLLQNHPKFDLTQLDFYEDLIK